MWRLADRAVSRVVRTSLRAGARRQPPQPVNRRRAVVVEKVIEHAEDVRSLTLAAADDRPLPGWVPGAHIDVYLPSGRQRQYSLCGDRGEGTYRVGVRRISDGGGGSLEMHQLSAGSVITIGQPRNAFPFIPVERYFFLAGGIGITPILPMVRAAAAAGAEWSLVYAGRTRASMPFLDELSAIATATPEAITLLADDESGVPSPHRLLDLAPEGSAMYCCGPPGMIAGMRAIMPAPRINALHFERFSPPPVAGGVPFEIELQRTGRTVLVGAEQTALAAVRAALPGVAYSCQQGYCGTCRVRVLDGEVEHRDRFLSPQQRYDSMMLCVSRGDQRIVVDL
ncbi:Ferredoxin-NADP reductase [Frankineae bacterium MT45]|nr:Ferredoxin-NADP reductase [Frankineae bacterium MT45]